MPLNRKPDGLTAEDLERRSAPVLVSVDSDTVQADSDPSSKTNSPPCTGPQTGGGGSGSGKQDIPQS